jgi:hypothetical protein
MKPKSRFNLRLTTPDDLHLETFDHTKLSAINTCPYMGHTQVSDAQAHVW